MYDAVVVGLGGVGSFALRALAKSSGKFLGIERFALGHARGSSHGQTRIYRRAYFEHPSYVPWIEYSLKVFEELQDECGISLLQECGTLLIEASSSSHVKNGVATLPPMLQSSLDSAQEHGIPVEFLAHEDLKERFPQFWYNRDLVGLLEPGGLLRCDRIMSAALEQATASEQVEVMEHAHVTEIQETSSGVDIKVKSDVTGEEQVVSMRKLLLAAGAWTGQLVPSWRPHLTVTRQIQGWIDVSQTIGDTQLFDLHHMPSWVLSTPDAPLPIYGLPCDPRAEGEHRHWLKVGIHGRSIRVPDPTTNDPQVNVAEQAELQMSTARALTEGAWRSPGHEFPQFAQISPCLYTMTKDSHFLIGTPAPYKNVFCVAGLSGHGFKMTPVLGQMMADFALDNDLEPYENKFCRPSRFGV